MTSCMSLSGEPQKAVQDYTSIEWFDAESFPGVRFAITKVSLAKRIELARRIREIGRKAEFLEAGSDPREKLEAAVLGAEADRAYLEWGLAAIDGEAPDVGVLVERGPLELAKEIIARIKAACGLSEAERKN
jgi:hypothetical protein